MCTLALFEVRCAIVECCAHAVRSYGLQCYWTSRALHPNHSVHPCHPTLVVIGYMMLIMLKAHGTRPSPPTSHSIHLSMCTVSSHDMCDIAPRDCLQHRCSYGSHIGSCHPSFWCTMVIFTVVLVACSLLERHDIDGRLPPHTFFFV